jgi:hypothetical protein
MSIIDRPQGYPLFVVSLSGIDLSIRSTPIVGWDGDGNPVVCDSRHGSIAIEADFEVDEQVMQYVFEKNPDYSFDLGFAAAPVASLPLGYRQLDEWMRGQFRAAVLEANDEFIVFMLKQLEPYVAGEPLPPEPKQPGVQMRGPNSKQH